MTGEFRYVEGGQHAGQGRVIEPFLVVQDPVCITPVVFHDPSPVWGRWIQIGWPWGYSRTWPTPGSEMRVVVEDCHEPTTNWHIGDIFCDVRLAPRDTQ